MAGTRNVSLLFGVVVETKTNTVAQDVKIGKSRTQTYLHDVTRYVCKPIITTISTKRSLACSYDNIKISRICFSVTIFLTKSS